jgi:excisionase family DNA binding protein
MGFGFYVSRKTTMSTIDQEYLTVDEAARLLRVATSTIRRWIRQGDLPAYRIGHRRVALRREDLNGLITPARSEREIPHYTIYTDISQVPKPTSEEIEDALEAMERAVRHSEEIFARRGKQYPSSGELIREIRDERTRQLG